MKMVICSVVLAGCVTGLVGCGGTAASTAPTGPLSFTKEEAAAIASKDTSVEDEEGGAFIRKARSAPAKRKTK